jgi:hypothetical protein
MRHFLFFIIFFLSGVALAQNGSESVEWQGFKSFDIGDQQFEVPYFKQNHVFNGEDLLWSKSYQVNQRVDEFSINITNLKTQNLRSSELGRLDRSQIPNGLQYSLRNALSRKRNYAQLSLSPI